MKISILQQDLLPSLQTVSRSVGTKGTLPVLNNILLQTDQGQLVLSATNLEVGVVKRVNVEVIEEGQTTVPARLFLEIIASLNNEKITLEAKSDQLAITSPSFEATLNGISATEFPTIPFASEETITLTADILQKALMEITFAAAVDEGRPVLTGILTEVKKNILELVATDGFRLAHKRAKLQTSLEKDLKTLIPRRTFEEVVRLIGEELKGEKDEQIEISTSNNQNQIIFKIGQTQLSSRLIEGQFPAWEKIVPQSFQNRAVVDKAELLKALKLASVFARNEANIIKLETQEDSLKITSEAKELGGQKAEVTAQVEGDKINIVFNSKYLIEALQACPSAQVVIEFSGNLSPALIKSMGEEGLEYVIMPIRLS